MRPLCLAEWPQNDWDLKPIVLSGLLPAHFLAKKPQEHLRAYVSDYLKEEIAAEASEPQSRRLWRILALGALRNGEFLNLDNLGREVAVLARAIANYFDVLQDTLIGDKFYFFDVGRANFLARRRPPSGDAWIWQLVWMEPDPALAYWRSASGFEVDFLLGDKQLAIAVKSVQVHESDWKVADDGR